MLTQIDIVFVVETWLNCSVSDAELSAEGQYQVFRRDRGSRGGGVLILVKKGILCREVSVSSDCEAVCVDILADGGRCRFICAYLSNTGQSAIRLEQMTTLCQLLDSLCETDAEVVVCGDFNLPGIDWNALILDDGAPIENVFINCCLMNGLVQMVEGVTRPANPSGVGTLLDLVLASDPGQIENLQIRDPPINSDHNAIYFDFLKGIPLTKDHVGGYDFWRGDYECIALCLTKVHWRSIFSSCRNVDEMYTCFVQCLHTLFEMFIPVRSKIKAHHQLRSYLGKLTQLMGKNDDLKLQKKLEKATRRLRILEESNLDFKDARSFYRYANKRLKGRETLGPITSGDTLITCDAEKSKIFGEFFSSVYVEPSHRNTCHECGREYSFQLCYGGECTFCLRRSDQCSSQAAPLKFSVEDVLQKIKDLPAKCSHAPDGIPPIVVKKLAREIAEPLHIIYQRSYNDGEVPSLFKQSIVTPVFKKGLRSDVENYRPIAQGCIACIVFEKLLVDHITTYLSSHVLMDGEQHGFVKGRSTATQLVTTTQDWSCFINKKMPFDVIYFDLSKAFDRVPHARLLCKLKETGLDKATFRWIHSYLQNRTCAVKINNTIGETFSCKSGVPQGSSIGPLLFCIFMLDLKKFIPSAVTYKLYADDLKMYCPVDQAIGAVSLQGAVDGLSRWCDQNDMLIAADKCVVMKYKASDTKYVYNGTLIPEKSETRDLGVIVSPQLDFRSHLTATLKSITALVNTIFRCFSVKRTEFYVRLYKTLVIPRLLYCCEVWRPYHKKYIDALERAQGRFIKRAVLRCACNKNEISLCPVQALHIQADQRMYNRIERLGMKDAFFNCRANTLRSGHTISSVEVARTEVVNNMWSWRVCRQLREAAKLPKPLNCKTCA